MDQKDVLDESYSKARKMDSEYFTSTLDPVHSDLLKIISSNLLEGTRSTKNIKTELYKLNVYGTHLIFHSLRSDTMLLSRQRVILQASC
jgi:hypothetical protein